MCVETDFPLCINVAVKQRAVERHSPVPVGAAPRLMKNRISVKGGDIVRRLLRERAQPDDVQRDGGHLPQLNRRAIVRDVYYSVDPKPADLFGTSGRLEKSAA